MGGVKKVKGLGRTIWELQKSHRDIKYSIGNTVNNSVMTMYSPRWALEVLG